MAAVIFTITETRTSPTVNFITEDWDLINYIQKYNNIRKRIDPAGWTTSPDLLSRTIMHTFTSKEDLITFVNDPLVAARIVLVDDYNATNGITSTRVES
jgi:hypothetical protein